MKNFLPLQVIRLALAVAVTIANTARADQAAIGFDHNLIGELGAVALPSAGFAPITSGAQYHLGVTQTARYS